MKYFYSGDDAAIKNRLYRDKRDIDLILIQIHTKSYLSDKPGMLVLTEGEFYPVCPAVGDTLFLKGCYVDADENKSEPKYYMWKVIGRHIQHSGPNSMIMNGMVEILVEPAGQMFDQGEE